MGDDPQHRDGLGANSAGGDDTLRRTLLLVLPYALIVLAYGLGLRVYVGRHTRGYWMSPSEVRACYQLYAAHRKSREMCAFPATSRAINDVAELDNLAMLLRLQDGFEGLASALGLGDPSDDLLHAPATHSRVDPFRKMLISIAARIQRN